MRGSINCILADRGIEERVSTKKIVNEIKNIDDDLLQNHSKLEKLSNLYIDGKKGPVAMKNSRTRVADLHTVITEPNSKFVSHFEPKNGKGLSIAHEIHTVILEHNSEDSLLALGVDGAATNTGMAHIQLFVFIF